MVFAKLATIKGEDRHNVINGVERYECIFGNYVTEIIFCPGATSRDRMAKCYCCSQCV